MNETIKITEGQDESVEDCSFCSESLHCGNLSAAKRLIESHLKNENLNLGEGEFTELRKTLEN